jgi:aspartate-semialdehyde dehydrogenase
MSRTPVVVLGATGMVGQRIVQRLAGHPQLRVVGVAASERSVGKPYREACTWRLPGAPFGEVGDLEVLPCEPAAMPSQARVALSALDRVPALAIEAAFRDAGYAVVSNASAWREDPLVPLVIPEVNPEHLRLISKQPGAGYIVTNPNCCAIPLALTVAPLHRRWGIEALVTSTWQAVSGAGYPGESAWDMVGNVHPHNAREEQKLESEPLKILGSADAPAAFPISARCVRVPTADGHLLSLQLRLKGAPSPEEVIQALRDFEPPIPPIPSSPRPLFWFGPYRDRPSPRFDADNGDGMAVTVGNIERCPVMGIKLFTLAHNTVRGAAGAAIANVELLRALELLP